MVTNEGMIACKCFKQGNLRSVHFNLLHFVNILFYKLSKYLQSDWSRRVHYWPYCTLSLKIVFFDKKQKHCISVAQNKLEFYY